MNERYEVQPVTSGPSPFPWKVVKGDRTIYRSQDRETAERVAKELNATDHTPPE